MKLPILAQFARITGQDPEFAELEALTGDVWEGTLIGIQTPTGVVALSEPLVVQADNFQDCRVDLARSLKAAPAFAALLEKLSLNVIDVDQIHVTSITPKTIDVSDVFTTST